MQEYESVCRKVLDAISRDDENILDQFLAFSVIHIVRFEADQIVECWGCRQLGGKVVPEDGVVT